MPWKYRKLLSNVGNAFQALLGQPKGDGPAGPGGRGGGPGGAGRGRDRLHLRRGGGRGPGGQLRVKPVPGFEQVLGGSTWQSLTRGTGNVETDYLNGELVRIARRHGQDAPINATMAALVRQAAARGDRPGDMTLEQLSQVLSAWLSPRIDRGNSRSRGQSRCPKPPSRARGSVASAPGWSRSPAASQPARVHPGEVSASSGPRGQQLGERPASGEWQARLCTAWPRRRGPVVVRRSPRPAPTTSRCAAIPAGRTCLASRLVCLLLFRRGISSLSGCRLSVPRGAPSPRPGAGVVRGERFAGGTDGSAALVAVALGCWRCWSWWRWCSACSAAWHLPTFHPGPAARQSIVACCGWEILPFIWGDCRQRVVATWRRLGEADPALRYWLLVISYGVAALVLAVLLRTRTPGPVEARAG